MYHPQMYGLVEKFNYTLKKILKKFIAQDPRDLDQLLPALIFTTREMPQLQQSFHPSNCYVDESKGAYSTLVWETWGQVTRVEYIVQYVLKVCARLELMGTHSRKNLKEAQKQQ